MQPPSWYFHRLRSMDSSEILWRIRTLLGGQVDLLRMPLGLYPRLKAEQRVWTGAEGNGFSVLPIDADWESDGEPFRGWSRRLCDKADSLLLDELSFFDLERQFLGAPIDWHRDWSAGKLAPLKLSGFIDYRDFQNVGDCKLVWEPNRHHQFVVLADHQVLLQPVPHPDLSRDSSGGGGTGGGGLSVLDGLFIHLVIYSLFNKLINK